MLMLALAWEARRRCIEFWLKVTRMIDNRMIRLVALEAWEVRNKVKQLEDLVWRHLGG